MSANTLALPQAQCHKLQAQDLCLGKASALCEAAIMIRSHLDIIHATVSAILPTRPALPELPEVEDASLPARS